jgi:predicted transcriptional regulator
MTARAVQHPETTRDRTTRPTTDDAGATTDDAGTADVVELPVRLASAQAKLVYLYLLTRGTATVDELGRALQVPKLTLFSVLGTLDEYGLVARDGDVVTTA